MVYCVYMIWSVSTPRVYIGSTCRMYKRVIEHRYNAVTNGGCTSKILLAYPDHQYLILEDGIKNRTMARSLERKHVEGWGCLAVNKNRAYITPSEMRLETIERSKQWAKNNRERKNEHTRAHYARNKDQILSRIRERRAQQRKACQ